MRRTFLLAAAAALAAAALIGSGTAVLSPTPGSWAPSAREARSRSH